MLVLSEKEDEWIWVLEDSGSFSVKPAILFLDSLFAPEPILGVEELR
jgi:hypothetical protein